MDDTIPANVSNGLQGRAGPYGSTWSSDDFFYTPVENLTAAFAEVNQCDNGPNASYHYATAYDSVGGFYCVAPFGQCDRGGPVVRCSFDDTHNWPFYYNYDKPYYGLTVWAFFLANPLDAATVDARDAVRIATGLK